MSGVIGSHCMLGGGHGALRSHTSCHARPRILLPGKALWIPGTHRPDRRICQRLHLATRPRASAPNSEEVEGPSTDLNVISTRISKLVLPYWQEVPEARWRLAGVVALTLATTGVSVVFNFLGRDFFNALSEKDVEGFSTQLVKYLAGFVVGIPVFVFKGYYQSILALEWREWLTKRLMQDYFEDRSFYQLQSSALVDNPDQRISSDIRQFTDTALGLSLVLLNSVIDLVSFSEILYSIYPPLFLALLVYSVGGTVGSIYLGKSLVGLNFNQEAREADLRYGLVRVRENAESIAFYGGESSEMQALMKRLNGVVKNYFNLLVASRNLDFFTSFYRFLIQLLPAAVVAPLYFSGKIEFGVINQSQSAFNHILNDVSLVVYQFEALAGFSAVVDRLGEFQEVVVGKLQHGKASIEATGSGPATATATEGEALQPPGASPKPAAQPAAAAQPSAATTSSSSSSSSNQAAAVTASAPAQGAAPSSSSSSSLATAGAAAGVDRGIVIVHVTSEGASAPATLGAGSGRAGDLLLSLQDLSICTPDGSVSLVQHLNLEVHQGKSLLIMGPSGAGKTSMLRTLAGLWRSGQGSITSYNLPGLGDPGNQPGSVLFLPQRPYMVLGSLQDQLLYPTWAERGPKLGDGVGAKAMATSSSSSSSSGSGGGAGGDGSSSVLMPGGGNGAGSSNGNGTGGSSSSSGGGGLKLPPVPTTAQLVEVLHKVQLSTLLDRCAAAAAAFSDGSSSSSSSREEAALNYVADWAAQLSLGEQQRLAFARLLLAGPRMALLDEATSALDTTNEAILYKAVLATGVTVISVGHRPSLMAYHKEVLLMGTNSAGGRELGSWRLMPAGEAAAAVAANVGATATVEDA